MEFGSIAGKRLLFRRPGADETDQVAKDCWLRNAHGQHAGRNLRVHFCLVEMERVTRVETIATTHVGCVPNQASLALDDLTLGTIEEEGVAAKLVFLDGFQFEFD